MPLIILQILLLVTSSVGCELYLAPSKYVEGVGVFAGTTFEPHYKFPEHICVMYLPAYKWMLNNYVFTGYRPEHYMVEFGIAMILNHHERNQVSHFFSDAIHHREPTLKQISSFQALLAYTAYPLTHFQVLLPIHVGDEIFNTYGDASWFQSKGIEYKPPPDNISVSYSLSELQQKGQCLTKVYLAKSPLPLAGHGIFARTRLQVGELAQVTPVLVLPLHEVVAVSNITSVLLNYCLSHPQSDIALLPIGDVGLVNHGGGSLANIALEWFFWNEQGAKALEQSPEQLRRADAASLYLGYRVTRGIAKGEELLLDYGDAWVKAWNEYIEARRNFQLFTTSLPLFRQPIVVPDHLFPSQWRVPCIGDSCIIMHDEL